MYVERERGKNLRLYFSHLCCELLNDPGDAQLSNKAGRGYPS